MTDIDYNGEDYPYHVEMLKDFSVSQGNLHIVFENSKSSDFPLESIGLDENTIKERLQYSARSDILCLPRQKENPGHRFGTDGSPWVLFRIQNPGHRSR